MGNPWEEDFFDDDFNGEESTDMGDEPSEAPQTIKPVTGTEIQYRQTQSRTQSFPNKPPNRQVNGKGKRTVRVRPMPTGMAAKWPDISSCLITLNSGKQVLFVKGG